MITTSNHSDNNGDYITLCSLTRWQ